MSPSAAAIKTITFPDRDLLEAVGPLPAGIRGAVWDFAAAPDGLDVADVDGVVLPYLNAGAVLGALSRAGNLKFVQAQTTGVDGIREAVGDGVAIASAAGVHAASTAELAVGLVLASLRGIDTAVRDQLEGRWRHERRASLADRRVLLVGVGGIGAEIAKRLLPFEVELTRVGTQARDDDEGHVHGADELVQLAGATDVMIVITPLTDATRGLINAEVLAALPDGALVVNVARGAVVDSDALTAEVVSGRLKCAIDVFDPEPIPADHPLWKAENALITPHVGGDTSAFEPRIVRLLQRQLEALSNGNEPQNLVHPGRIWG
ncbi:phosphoglycerate dehydrogenase-like oxidoreductase [Arthrobacter crystallopoietes BAB-32]|uniref:Phosphoglycerate dehydrogenase-like oxidoreductase n=1 Tax=Arthrobacter crystallopoietes BAB-32 TaxID=1246476 RepID=N1UZA9_9MICC|nr:2-hydroxyacid dehydrogenase [Arthrobacter crystallopoietes]EMY34395.1 phosphoglycerate dehydrogenase-like oxidoreductase [Arthrobacter crystallopoietes BAB-32]